ncbi:hypothetical protein DM2_2319 [Halorubrum sp. DM2]|nr:hypothetical protein DM2_2319 [Halorubrum sp. DM2]
MAATITRDGPRHDAHNDASNATIDGGLSRRNHSRSTRLDRHSLCVVDGVDPS